MYTCLLLALRVPLLLLQILAEPLDMALLWEKVPYIAEFVEDLPVGESGRSACQPRSQPVYHVWQPWFMVACACMKHASITIPRGQSAARVSPLLTGYWCICWLTRAVSLVAAVSPAAAQRGVLQFAMGLLVLVV